MADSRRKSGAGSDRPLHEVSAAADRSEDVGAARAPPAAGDPPTGDQEADVDAGLAPPAGQRDADVGAGLAPPADLQRRVHELEERLAQAEAERDERLNDLRRVAADFDNFRKRAARDQEKLVARAHERLMKALLPVLDDLERALVAAAEHEEAKLHEGVELVARELREAVKREGLEEIEADGQFDPHVHEALLSQPSEREEGAVIEVLQKGYRLGDRVLRPARVVISQGVPQEAESE